MKLIYATLYGWPAVIQLGHDCLKLAENRPNQLSWVELSWVELLANTCLVQLGWVGLGWVELRRDARPALGFTNQVFRRRSKRANRFIILQELTAGWPVFFTECTWTAVLKVTGFWTGNQWSSFKARETCSHFLRRKTTRANVFCRPTRRSLVKLDFNIPERKVLQ